MSGLKPLTTANLALWILLFGLSIIICGQVHGQPGSFPLSFEEGRLRGWIKSGSAFADQKTSENDPTMMQTPPIAVKPQTREAIRLAPRIQLKADNVNPPVGKNVQFEATNITGIKTASYKFIFGDGIESGWIPEPCVNHVYGKPGDYKAFLSIKEASVLSTALTRTLESDALVIHVHDVRVALRILSNPPTFAGQEARFEIRSEPYDSDIRYLVAFGDGQETGWQDQPIIDHQYASEGSYKVVGWVSFDRKTPVASDSLAVEISAVPVPSTVRLEASPRNIRQGRPVMFAAFLDSRITGFEYGYDFGDGTAVLWTSQRQLEHVYPSPGEFRARVTARKGDLIVAESDAVTITVTPPPADIPVKQVVFLRADPVTPTPGREVRFSGAMKPGGPGARYRFDFGDGIQSEWQGTPEAVHAYANPGQFAAVLVVRMQGREFPSNMVGISVREGGLAVRMRASLERTSPGNPIEFRAEVRPPSIDVEYQFVFGDDKTTDWSHRLNVEHAYARKGTYGAYVRARRDPANMAKSDIFLITIESPYPPIPWGGLAAGLLVLGGGGVLLSRSIRARKMIRHIQSILQARPRQDPGVQYIESDEPHRAGLEVRLRPATDQGKQEIEADEGIVMDERREN
jgi:PKD repeat protein